MYHAAINDFTYVIEHPKVENAELIPAMWGRARMYIFLDNFDSAMLDFNKAKEIDPDFPKIEVQDDILVWRNINPLCLTNDFKDHFTCSMIHIGVCKSQESITFTDTGVCVIKTSSNCGCDKCNKELLKDRSCNNCGQHLSPFSKNAKNNNPTNETDCDYWCDRVFVSAQILCGGCPNLLLKATCAGVAEACKQKCHKCCRDNGFYRDCVKPFENFLEAVGSDDPIY